MLCATDDVPGYRSRGREGHLGDSGALLESIRAGNGFHILDCMQKAKTRTGQLAGAEPQRHFLDGTATTTAPHFLAQEGFGNA